MRPDPADEALPPPAPGLELARWAPWGVLVVLLALLGVGVLRLDRSTWPAMVGDEPTFAMQAASLAWDGDLAYERRDYDRFVERWGAPPENLILQSTDGGERITFSKPFFYAAVAAPFLRLAPERGAALANFFFLLLAAVAAARTLERQIGPAAPVWVAVFLGASVSFVYVYWFHGDLFLMCMTVLGLSLAVRTEHAQPAALPDMYDLDVGEPRRRYVARWALVGALLAVPTAVRPFHAALLVAVALAIPAGRRRLGVAALAGGAALVLAGGLLVHAASGGSWMGYGSERQGFYSYTGYPDVDFSRSEWSDSLRRWGNTSWIHEGTLEVRFDRDLWAWNGVYLLAGQHVGLLPYFLPLLLGLVAFKGGRFRWALLLAVVAVALCFFLVRPFNFWGGSGAVANRYFLPLYPVFWFLAGGTVRYRFFWPILCAGVAAVFLLPTWRSPLAYPLSEDGGYRHVSAVARRYLPYETTQSHLKPSGQEDVNHNGLWIKFLDRAMSAEAGGERLVLRGDEGHFLVGSSEPLEALRVGIERGSTSLPPEGGALGEMMLRSDGGIVWELLVAEHVRAHHPMWWTWDHVYLYEIRLPSPNRDRRYVSVEPGPIRPR